MSGKLDGRTTVGEVLVRHPETRQVFQRFGIDWKEKASQQLAKIASETGISLEALLSELATIICKPKPDPRFDKNDTSRPLSELVGYIESRHHGFLRRELPRLEGQLMSATSGGRSAPAPALRGIARIFPGFRTETEAHLRTEEEILFPYIKQVEAYSRGAGPSPQLKDRAIPDIFQKIAKEHDSMLRLLAKLKEITDDYSLDSAAPADLRALYKGLQALDWDLQDHIRLENSLEEHIERMYRDAEVRERLDRDLDTAREVQQTLLPQKLPEMPGSEDLSLCVKALPAREVGGDLHDFFYKDEKTLVLALGDVSGNGIPAALLMTMTWTLLRTYAGKEDSPSEVLKKMNETLQQATSAAKFVTMFLAYYDIENRTLRFANAGHCPPIFANLDGSTEIPGPTAPILGLFEEFESKDVALTLSPGQKVIAYSDGITEASGPDGDMFGASRLEELISKSVGDTPEDLLEKVIGAVQEYQGGSEETDDTTIWVLEAR